MLERALLAIFSVAEFSLRCGEYTLQEAAMRVILFIEGLVGLKDREQGSLQQSLIGSRFLADRLI